MLNIQIKSKWETHFRFISIFYIICSCPVISLNEGEQSMFAVYAMLNVQDKAMEGSCCSSN